MVNIQHNIIAHSSGPIYGVAGYYSDNNDSTSAQHVIVATTDGKLYETHWNQSTTHTPAGASAFTWISSLAIQGDRQPGRLLLLGR